MIKIRNIFFTLVVLFMIGCETNHKKPTVDFQIQFEKSNSVKTPFIGHGVQWSAYPHADAKDAEWGLLMTDEKWNELYRRLDFVHPNIIRVMDVASWRYFEGLDKNKEPILNFKSQELKSLCKLLDYCQSRNIPVLFGEWGAAGFWEKEKNGNRILKANDSRWISMITQYLEFLIIEKGYTCIQYYNLVNEPNGYWASTDGDWDQWKEGYQKLNIALKETKLDKFVQMSGPDAVTQWDHPTHPKKAHDWMYSTVSELDEETGLYDFHIYADQYLIRSGDFVEYLETFTNEISKTHKPVVLGELGMKYSGELKEENKRRGDADPFAGPDDSSMFVYDYFYGVDMADAAIQSMLAGVGGAIAWDLDDAMHTVGDLGEKNQLKKWGMWNILAEEFGDLEVDKKPRPWSYSWTLMCNLFPAKSKIFIPNNSVVNDSIRSVAMQSKHNVSFAFVNQSSKAKSIGLKSELLSGANQLYLYEYSENYRPMNKAGFPIPSKEIKTNLGKEEIVVELKENSLVFLSSILIK
jgi:hypothetical protein